MNDPQPVLFATRAEALGEREVCVRVEGELDLATAPELDELLRRELGAGNDVVIDLSKVTFMDSSGLHVIVTALRSHNSDLAQVRLAGSLLPQIRRLIEITGLQQLIPVDCG